MASEVSLSGPPPHFTPCVSAQFISLASMFTTTSVYEQTFSKMKNVKLVHQTTLTDERPIREEQFSWLDAGIPRQILTFQNLNASFTNLINFFLNIIKSF